MSSARREKVKGAILAFLVILSLGLSLGLWWGAAGPLTGGELWREQPASAPSPPAWSRVIRPGRLLLHGGEGKHALILPGSPAYDRLWGQGCERGAVLQGLGPPRQESLREGEARALREEGVALEALFWEPLPWDLLVQAYGLRGNFEDVEGFVFAPGRYPQVAVKRAGRLYPLEGARDRPYQALGDLLAGWTPQEALAVESPRLPPGWQGNGLFVPTLTELPRLASGFEPPPGYAQDMVRLFFPDPTLVRRIEERDGATIFTDGRLGLRLYPRGALEFTTPRAWESRGELDAEAALSAALAFLASHGGYPEEAVLWGCWPLRQEQRWLVLLALEAGGWPALAPEGVWSLVVGEQGVCEFRREAWVPWAPGKGSRRLFPLSEALLRLAAAEKGENPQVMDIYLAYLGFPGAGELHPAWVVRTERGTRTVDAITGKVTSLGGRR